MTRVLHVYSGNLFGGVESVLVAIAKFQHFAPAVRHEFAVCFEGRLRDELLAAGATVHLLPAPRFRQPWSMVVARRTLSALLGRERFDSVVCHAPWTHAVFGRVVNGSRIPLMFWAHDAIFGRHWTERLARFTPPDLALCNSEFTASTLPVLYRDAPVAIVYAPVPAAPVQTAIERRQLRAALDTRSDAIVIVQASRIDPLKGHLVLVDALARLADVPGWVWWVAGGAQQPGEEQFLDELRRAADRAGIADRVRWLGLRSDVGDLLAAADIYCQANVRPDAFGIAFVEALAAGLPVVTSRLGGAPEIIDDSTGILVPAGDAHATADALRRLIDDPARRADLASAAADRARQLCDPAVQLRHLAAVLSARPEAVAVPA